MYLNLLFKSIKADAGNADGERIKVLVSRFMQILVSRGGGATEFVAGCSARCVGYCLCVWLVFSLVTIAVQYHTRA